MSIVKSFVKMGLGTNFLESGLTIVIKNHRGVSAIGPGTFTCENTSS